MFSVGSASDHCTLVTHWLHTGYTSEQRVRSRRARRRCRARPRCPRRRRARRPRCRRRRRRPARWAPAPAPARPATAPWRTPCPRTRTTRCCSSPSTTPSCTWRTTCGSRPTACVACAPTKVSAAGSCATSLGARSLYIGQFSATELREYRSGVL